MRKTEKCRTAEPYGRHNSEHPTRASHHLSVSEYLLTVDSFLSLVFADSIYKMNIRTWSKNTLWTEWSTRREWNKDLFFEQLSATPLVRPTLSNSSLVLSFLSYTFRRLLTVRVRFHSLHANNFKTFNPFSSQPNVKSNLTSKHHFIVELVQKHPHQLIRLFHSPIVSFLIW